MGHTGWQAGRLGTYSIWTQALGRGWGQRGVLLPESQGESQEGSRGQSGPCPHGTDKAPAAQRAVICPEAPSPHPAPHASRPPRLPVLPLPRPQSSHLCHEGWVGCWPSTFLVLRTDCVKPEQLPPRLGSPAHMAVPVKSWNFSDVGVLLPPSLFLGLHPQQALRPPGLLLGR